MFKRFLQLLFATVICSVISMGAFAQPAPKDVLGFTPGDDYKLAHWAKIVEYFQKLDASSDRMVFKEIGKTTNGNPFTYALISSPDNLNKLDYYKDINDKLADPRKIDRSMKEAKALAKKGKTFVLITHGIHSTEVGSTLSSTLLAHTLVTSKEERVRKILDNTIIVLVPALNPDGVDIVKDWYDKTLGTDFEGTTPPELYQKYVGHDNNRDWYAFTQKETQLTVEKIHNVYHPQIVHDIHQQGQNGARFFVPPYLDPVEPNVPKEIIEGYSEIGNYIADEMRKGGLKGITTGSTYDAWTPARAYSHYHGGARILSETASARLASPVEIKPEQLRSRRGFDVNKVSKNYGPLWKGGKWGMRDITNHMTIGAMHLLDHAAKNRVKWLERFHKIGYDATRPRKKGELNAFVIEPGRDSWSLVSALERGGVELIRANPKPVNGKKFPEYSRIVMMNQPYGSFARAMIGKVKYPNLLDDAGNPIPPYDVTAHDLGLLTGTTVHQLDEKVEYDPWRRTSTAPIVTIRGLGLDDVMAPGAFAFSVFRSAIPNKDEGWTRWILEQDRTELHSLVRARGSRQAALRNISSSDIIAGKGENAIVFPDQSPNQILNGYAPGTRPKELVGGVGKEGVARLKKFVEDGGTLVFMNRSSDFAIEHFDLPLTNIAKDWKGKDFFIPGSILRTQLDTSHGVAKDMPKESIAWFERSPVFELKRNKSETKFARIIAKYPDNPDEILLAGWAHGKEKIAGKAALVEVRMGRGKIVLFGFRPQYRGQSRATFPLLFNAITY